LHAVVVVASRRSGAARPHGIPGATLDGTGACAVWLAPGMPCGSPPGGRWDATPRPPNPAQQSLRLASRRSARPARAQSFRLATSSGRPSRSSDHSPKDGIYQRKYPSLVGVTSRCCASFCPLRRLTDGPGAGPVHGGDGCAKGLLNAAWLTEAVMARYQTSRGVVQRSGRDAS
jgi:hypothetical protein